MAKRATSVAKLGSNGYGKSRVRMVKVIRTGKRHTVREFDVSVRLQGDFETIHTAGDNRLCLPTDTMKNTVYALGKDHPIDSIESFAMALCEHFVERNAQVSLATVRVAEVRWERLSVRGREHPHCFLKGSEEKQVCNTTCFRSERPRKLERVFCGRIEGLTLLKSSDSAFSGFPKDEYTTLREAEDRIFATQVSAFWPYVSKKTGKTDHAAARSRIRTALIEAFAKHKSKSVQHTLFAMGEAALKACREINQIQLEMPNKHCLLVNLAPFGMDNKNEIFVPTDEPHGLIEATVERR